MDIRSTIADLYRQMAWADVALWAAVLKEPAAGQDGKLKELLYHLHAVQHGFLGMWSGVAFEGRPPEAADFTDLASLCRWGSDYHAAAAQFLQKLDPARLDGPMVLPWADAYVTDVKPKATPTTMGETLIQVPMHSMHHRGQAAARLRAAGGEPPTTDFIMWAWLGKPEPGWPA
jgi:uncharacterized damage-inducible protein DinB